MTATRIWSFGPTTRPEGLSCAQAPFWTLPAVAAMVAANSESSRSLRRVNLAISRGILLNRGRRGKCGNTGLLSIRREAVEHLRQPLRRNVAIAFGVVACLVLGVG